MSAVSSRMQQQKTYSCIKSSKLRFKCSVLVVACLLLVFSTQSDAEKVVFHNSLAAVHWKLERGEFACRLTQTLYDYGRADLLMFRDGTLRFRVHAMPGLYIGQMVRVTVAPSPWQSGKTEVLALRSERRGLPVSLGDEAARRVLLAFTNGQAMRFIYPADRSPTVEVEIDSIGFRQELGRLQTCAAALPEVNFSRFAKTRVFFPEGSAQLTSMAKQKLKRLTSFINAFGEVKMLILVGHTDNVGSYAFNLRLGKQRAQRVAEFLRSQGMKRPIEVRSLGEADPLDSNSTPEGRARNRRVTIILVRTNAIQ